MKAGTMEQETTTGIDVALIGDEDTMLGFQLAGVKEAALFTPETVEESLERFAGAKILIMTERVAEHLREKDLMRKVRSVVAEIPDKGGSTGTAMKNISRLLESAIGVRLKE